MEDLIMADNKIAKKETEAPATTERAKETPIFKPRFDIYENDSDVVLVGDMPGVDETSVKIDLEGSELTIRGTFALETPEGYALTYQEYGSGDYERSFTLGDTIDRDGIKAVVKDGVLRLTLPKAKEAQPKRIAVNAG
jgi:HSP20 family molecular chaperone IbpA